jgi:hypothetical protein
LGCDWATTRRTAVVSRSCGERLRISWGRKTTLDVRYVAYDELGEK